MAASAWAIFDKAKKKLGNGTIQLGVNVFKMQLHTSAAVATLSANATLSTAASAGNEVTGANGYATGGAALASVTWSIGASAGILRFDCADPVWTATGGTIPDIKYAVIKNSAGHALCYSMLTTAQFTLAQNNTLTVQINASGLFQLS